MDRIFQALSAGLAKFIYGWLAPSAIAVGTIAVFLVPDLSAKYESVESGVDSLPDNSTQQILVFTIIVVALATMLSLTLARPTARLLEGYIGPRRLRNQLRRRKVTKYRRLRLLADRKDIAPAIRASAQLELLNFPRHERSLLPTSLGNRLRASELFASDVYGLDALRLWYELVAVAPDTSRSIVTDERTALDFYISSILNTAVVLTASASVAILTGSTKAVVLILVAFVLLPVLYVGAVAQSSEYGAAIRGMVNCSRAELAEALGYGLPNKIDEEQRFWGHIVWGLFGNPGDLQAVDHYRIRFDSDPRETSSRST